MTRVLLVEDEPMILMAYKRMFEHAGHEVIIAGSALAAIDAIRHDTEDNPIDIIVLDLELHGTLSGLDVLAHTPPRIQRVILSGHSPEHVRERVDPLSTVPFYFSKPLDSSAHSHLLTIIAVAGRKSR